MELSLKDLITKLSSQVNELTEKVSILADVGRTPKSASSTQSICSYNNEEVIEDITPFETWKESVKQPQYSMLVARPLLHSYVKYIRIILGRQRKEIYIHDDGLMDNNELLSSIKTYVTLALRKRVVRENTSLTPNTDTKERLEWRDYIKCVISPMFPRDGFAKGHIQDYELKVEECARTVLQSIESHVSNITNKLTMYLHFPLFVGENS